ncbi:MarR family winged helix-turn-helix transcriptional regulator [Intrasporangium mesophilum]
MSPAKSATRRSAPMATDQDTASPDASAPPVAADLRLDAQICYAMHTTVRAFDAVYRSLLKQHGLSYPQYIALMTIGEHGALTVGELGDLMRLDSGTLSPLLKRMEAADLVARHRDPGDERRVRVELTPAGRERLAAVAGIPRAIVERSGLDRARLAELRSTLRALVDTLEDDTTPLP